jgi:E3 ubiquitin-protein ligase RNF14
MITTLANEILSIREVLSSSVPCPRCGIGISRISGCDHMCCRKCGKRFNYALARRNNVTAIDFIEEDKAQKEPRVRLSVSVRQYPCAQCRKPHPKVILFAAFRIQISYLFSSSFHLVLGK